MGTPSIETSYRDTDNSVALIRREWDGVGRPDRDVIYRLSYREVRFLIKDLTSHLPTLQAFEAKKQAKEDEALDASLKAARSEVERLERKVEERNKRIWNAAPTTEAYAHLDISETTRTS